MWFYATYVLASISSVAFRHNYILVFSWFTLELCARILLLFLRKFLGNLWIGLICAIFYPLFKMICLITCLLLYWPKIHSIFFISHYLGIESDSFYFLRLKFSLLDIKILKKKTRQTFRPHMGALFSTINSKFNSKFL